MTAKSKAQSMNKSSIIILTLVTLVIVGVVGYSIWQNSQNDSNDTIVSTADLNEENLMGTWNRTDSTTLHKITFLSENKLQYKRFEDENQTPVLESTEGFYEIVDKKLKISVTTDNGSISDTYEAILSENNLILGESTGLSNYFSGKYVKSDEIIPVNSDEVSDKTQEDKTETTKQQKTTTTTKKNNSTLQLTGTNWMIYNSEYDLNQYLYFKSKNKVVYSDAFGFDPIEYETEYKYTFDGSKIVFTDSNGKKDTYKVKFDLYYPNKISTRYDTMTLDGDGILYLNGKWDFNGMD